MTGYREDCIKAKDVRRGITPGKGPTANRKKPKVRGPWKVIRTTLSGNAGSIMYHCATKELAEKLARKHHCAYLGIRIECQEEK